MNTSIVLVFAILIALAIGFYIGKLLSKTQSNAEKSNLEGQLTSQSHQLTELKSSIQNLQIVPLGFYPTATGLAIPLQATGTTVIQWK